MTLEDADYLLLGFRRNSVRCAVGTVLSGMRQVDLMQKVLLLR
jgi:hypothetical protein